MPIMPLASNLKNLFSGGRRRSGSSSPAVASWAKRLIAGFEEEAAAIEWYSYDAERRFARLRSAGGIFRRDTADWPQILLALFARLGELDEAMQREDAGSEAGWQLWWQLFCAADRLRWLVPSLLKPRLELSNECLGMMAGHWAAVWLDLLKEAPIERHAGVRMRSDVDNAVRVVNARILRRQAHGSEDCCGAGQ